MVKIKMFWSILFFVITYTTTLVHTRFVRATHFDTLNIISTILQTNFNVSSRLICIRFVAKRLTMRHLSAILYFLIFGPLASQHPTPFSLLSPRQSRGENAKPVFACETVISCGIYRPHVASIGPTGHWHSEVPFRSLAALPWPGGIPGRYTMTTLHITAVSNRSVAIHKTIDQRVGFPWRMMVRWI